MKKFILLALLIVFNSNAIAQDNLSIKATKITNEVAEVLFLSEEDYFTSRQVGSDSGMHCGETQEG